MPRTICLPEREQLEKGADNVVSKFLGQATGDPTDAFGRGPPSDGVPITEPTQKLLYHIFNLVRDVIICIIVILYFDKFNC